jgi:hypothetical protein
VTDNASNLERTFNPNELRDSLPEWIGKPIAHVHCGVHGTNLALRDLEVRFPSFSRLRDELCSLLNRSRSQDIKTLLYGAGCRGKIPVIQEIKWMTFYAAMTFINNNFGQIVEVLPEVGASNLFAGSLWRSFSDAIMCFSKFALKIQADCTFLHCRYDEYLVTQKQLEDLTGNEFAFHL